MNEVFSKISKNVKRTQQKNKKLKKEFRLILVPNDRFLIQNGAVGKRTCVVVSSDFDIRTNKIKPENGRKPILKVHRSLSLKYNEKPFETSSPYS